MTIENAAAPSANEIIIARIPRTLVFADMTHAHFMRAHRLLAELRRAGLTIEPIADGLRIGLMLVPAQNFQWPLHHRAYQYKRPIARLLLDPAFASTLEPPRPPPLPPTIALPLALSAIVTTGTIARRGWRPIAIRLFWRAS